MNTMPDFDDIQEGQYLVDLPMFDRLSRDVRTLSVNLDTTSVRKLVYTYYAIQKQRIAMSHQTRRLQEAGSPHEMNDYLAANFLLMEKSLKYPLQRFAETTVAGSWALSQYGIGPVLAAGLSANIDITRAHTAGSVWRYAGLDPTIKWEKGQKRPYNADLKTLCWKMGQSFMKFHKNDSCFYGHLYKMDKERRIEKNNAGDYAEFAKEILSSKNFGDNPTRTTLRSGKLPDAQIDAQARRYAVKIFLSHYHAVAYQAHYDKPAPTPYIIAHGDHVHEISIPNNPF